MGLLERDDSVLVVVDAQPGFFRKDWFSGPDTAAAQAALERAAWLVAVAARPEIPGVVTEEEPERNGATPPLIGEQPPPGTAAVPQGAVGAARPPGSPP